MIDEDISVTHPVSAPPGISTFAAAFNDTQERSRPPSAARGTSPVPPQEFQADGADGISALRSYLTHTLPLVRPGSSPAALPDLSGSRAGAQQSDQPALHPAFMQLVSQWPTMAQSTSITTNQPFSTQHNRNPGVHVVLSRRESIPTFTQGQPSSGSQRISAHPLNPTGVSRLQQSQALAYGQTPILTAPIQHQHSSAHNQPSAHGPNRAASGLLYPQAHGLAPGRTTQSIHPATMPSRSSTDFRAPAPASASARAPESTSKAAPASAPAPAPAHTQAAAQEKKRIYETTMDGHVARVLLPTHIAIQNALTNLSGELESAYRMSARDVRSELMKLDTVFSQRISSAQVATQAAQLESGRTRGELARMQAELAQMREKLQRAESYAEEANSKNKELFNLAGRLMNERVLLRAELAKARGDETPISPNGEAVLHGWGTTAAVEQMEALRRDDLALQLNNGKFSGSYSWITYLIDVLDPVGADLQVQTNEREEAERKLTEAQVEVEQASEFLMGTERAPPDGYLPAQGCGQHHLCPSTKLKNRRISKSSRERPQFAVDSVREEWYIHGPFQISGSRIQWRPRTPHKTTQVKVAREAD